METNIAIDILPPIPYLVKFWFLSFESKCYSKGQSNCRILYNVISQERNE